VTSKTGSKRHWEVIYERSPVDDLGWYRPHLKVSLRLIASGGPVAGRRILDVGGGASTLADDLLDLGAVITVLDISPKALEVAQERLGQRASEISWMSESILTASIPGPKFDIWHDRAVFHFLTEEADRRRYLAFLRSGLKPGGYVIIGTFSHQAPPKCSGLGVCRYSADELAAEMGAGFEVEETAKDDHVTPGGVSQPYTYLRLCYLP
jgi:2-polyprenyl-3-methyl-5-hydroxy-6-metoxy-1,4-benzoquinol methylase